MMFFGVSQSLTPAILILDRGALKCAFLGFEVEPIFSEHVQDLGYDLPMVFNHVSVYQDIVQVNCHVAFINEVFEDVIHHGLEGSWAVHEAEEHNQRFEKSTVGAESGLPFISVFNPHIIEPPPYVQLGEVPSPSEHLY